MDCDQLLDEILALLYQVKESKSDLEFIHDFMTKYYANSKKENAVIPKKYRTAVHAIAEFLSMGMSCEFNTKTLKVEPILEDNNILEEEEEEGISPYATDTIIIPMLSSHESYDVMENFVHSLSDSPVKRSLELALNHNKPFAHFNAIIHELDEKNDWFAFRQAELENYVAKQLIYQNVWED